ncbi:MAG: response regulator [Pyrinomonadaceae bacterium]
MPHTILYVEDNLILRHTIKETLELEGWRVDACEDGTTALEKLKSDNHYDLLLLDNDLPGVGGLELIRHSGRLIHRRHMPVVMISAGEVEREARDAGAHEFLRKPDGIYEIVETISRLLADSGEE